jgi:hypothetical protein
MKNDLTAKRFARLADICLQLPVTAREDKGDHAAFLVRKKIFLYYLNDHHGDDIVALCCKVFPGEAAALVAASPDRYYLPAYLGARGWIGLRLDRRSVDWQEVAELVRGSYLLCAPKRLQSIVMGSASAG